ncbi:hypothetical protein CH305_05730 [Rhodococcus sp. 15-649-2-2]|uniref:hypothetical protein n=1 Tax=Rhodococcus sp. 15-649-2-2 TaxID=2023140 RepID=UPI000B9A35C0|nr:hypothetical protein [Rhodococcus sp. 15-649-2-2]OZE84123.1 hypothetical protein CH305_05730 [Rhodococcus sp. 15-649-2-2]
MTWRYATRLFLVIAVIVAGAVAWNVTTPDRPVAYIVPADSLQCSIPFPDRYFGVDSDATVPMDFEPVAAVTCDSFLGEEGAADRTVGYSEHRWEGDFSDAIGLLNRRSEHPTWFPDSCADDYSLAVLQEFWLIDHRGRAVRPGFPLNSCGRPKPGGLNAITELTEVRRIEHRALLSNDQIRTFFGCLPVYAPPQIGSTQPVALSVIGSWFCRFDSQRFVGARPIATSLSLKTLPLASPCDEAPTTVAAMRYSDADSYDQLLTVELDGCRRVIPDGHAPLQASAEILSEFR